MKTLWLVSWYPNKLSPLNGDFIKRHAEAVSLFDEVQVIYVVRDTKGILTKNVIEEKLANGRLYETIIYYFSSNRIPLLDKLFSAIRYKKIYRKAVKEYLHNNGRPDIVHVHVGMKAGSVAVWLRKKWGIDYVISEHWTGFLPEARNQYNSLPVYFQKSWRKVVKHAKACSAVSLCLKEALENKFPRLNVKVIPNVVNTNIFTITNQETKDFRFIHVSSLDDFKNFPQILKAFAIVIQTFPGAKLEIIGSIRPAIIHLANDLKLQDSISFYDEMPQNALAEHVKNATALILYSAYETFGCVIIEANACGIPVIVSDIPVFHEIIKEGENGYFATANAPADLANKMIYMLLNWNSFDSKDIAAKTARKYNYDVVGKQFSEWYKNILQKD